MTEQFDVIVVGSGVAGLAVALELAPLRVLLVTKRRLESGSSPLAQGGIAAAIAPGDSPELHAADTIRAAAGLALPEAVEALTRDGPSRVAELVDAGARFDRQSDGRLLFGREAAHSRSRILHAGGDATGAEIVRALGTAARRAEHIELREVSFVSDLVPSGDRMAGIVTLDAGNDRRTILAPCVVLATGGLGQLFLYTTNPLENTADGLAMAARAGARLADLEFVQFHPTALDLESLPSPTRDRAALPLLTEALRGEGARLVDETGLRFMRRIHHLAELAPRDVVAQAVWRQQREGHRIYLDASDALGASIPARFPTVFAACLQRGLDPRREPIPVTPAAHFAMGGIATDTCGRTSVPGLWACGEVAATGAHGANRLASNSLLEGLVFGHRTATDILAYGHCAVDRPRELAIGPCAAEAATMSRLDAERRRQLRRTMWQDVGLVRSGGSLTRALATLANLSDRSDALHAETRNMLVVARLITVAALARTESRGAHARTDYPGAEPRWQRRLYVSMPPGAWPETVTIELGEMIPEVVEAQRLVA